MPHDEWESIGIFASKLFRQKPKAYYVYVDARKTWLPPINTITAARLFSFWASSLWYKQQLYYKIVHTIRQSLVHQFVPIFLAHCG